MGRPQSRLTAREAVQLRKEGFDEGLQKGRQEILDWLEAAYMNPKTRPDRGSPEAEAILQVARDAANHFRTQVKKEARRG